MSEATIVIDENEARIRFKGDAERYAEPKHDSYLKWLAAGVSILDKNLDTKTYLKGEKTTILIQMPEEWGTHSAPGIKYAMYDLINNGMLSDWHDSRGSDKAKRYRQAAELNKAQIQSIINSIDK